MLGLSLALGDEVRIGPDIRVVVKSYSGGVVNLAFDAPRDLRISRSSEERLTREESRLARERAKRTRRRLAKGGGANG